MNFRLTIRPKRHTNINRGNNCIWILSDSLYQRRTPDCKYLTKPIDMDSFWTRSRPFLSQTKGEAAVKALRHPVPRLLLLGLLTSPGWCANVSDEDAATMLARSPWKNWPAWPWFQLSGQNKETSNTPAPVVITSRTSAAAGRPAFPTPCAWFRACTWEPSTAANGAITSHD